MKLMFKNTTQYTKKIYEEYLAFHQNQYQFSYILYTAIVIAAFLFCLGLQVRYHNFTLAILFCIAITCFLLWRILHPISEVSEEYKSDKIKKEQIFHFCFYDHYFTIDNEKEISKIRYRKLRRVFETPTFFYLYLDKTHAFLVDKSKFIRHKSPQFSTFLHKKCWWKYKKIKKS